MRIAHECLVCLVRQAVEAGRFLELPAAAREALIRSTLRHLAQCSWDITAPEIAAETQEFLRNLSGNDDPYRAFKEASAAAADRLVPDWCKQIASDSDPLSAALRIAAAGNLIDCGPTGRFDIEDIARRIAVVVEHSLSEDDLARFRNRVQRSRTLLLIADNVGELTADRLLLETIERLHPHLALRVMVRGGPVLNDATREDLLRGGFSPRWEALDTRVRIPGIPLHRCPDKVGEAFRQADLVIAKGQGNWETLDETPHPALFFLLTCKCPSIAQALGVKVGEPVLRASAAMVSPIARSQSPSSGV